MKIGIIPNLERDKDLAATTEAIGLIERFGGAAVVSYSIHDILNTSGFKTLQKSENIFTDSDILAVLGGDGTILRAAKSAAAYKKPVFGINLGRLGYLTDVEIHQQPEAFEMILSGRYTIEARMMLRAAVIAPSGEVIHSSAALNDVCVCKSVPSKMIELSLDIDGQFFERYRADGVIISTPTGSTAYNLSAGGPVLKPEAEMIAVTPVCPHTLYARSAVVPSSDCVTVSVLPSKPGSAADAVVTCDSDVLCVLKEGELLKIEKAAVAALIVRISNTGFYERMRQKLTNN